jgi:prepilin signal peptidase PulO-like enzyme (type II secretory pathway)
VVEMSMAIVVLMLLDAFFIGPDVRLGLSLSAAGITDRLAYDWPIFVAHVILLGCLFSMSAIDLEHYWVDVRFTNFAVAAGFVLHFFWTPAHSAKWPRPSDPTSVVSLLALVGLGLVWIVFTCQPEAEPDEGGRPDAGGDGETEPEANVRGVPPSLMTPSRASAWLIAAILVAMYVGLFLVDTGRLSLRYTPRQALPLLLFLVLIIWHSMTARPSDQQIVDAIEQERHGAREMVLSELVWLLPAVGFGLAGLWIMSGGGELRGRIQAALHSQIPIVSISMLRSWSPMQGLATAASGYIISGAAGWAIRIVFTLVFGKEAFGCGDIHLMAAAGCVAGWPIVVLGFFLACLLATLGWLVSLPFKRPRAIPLGPWLSLAFLTVVVFYDRMIRDWPLLARTVGAMRLLFLENSQPGG